MKRVLMLCLVATVVSAEEQLIGRIQSTDGGSVCNYSTGYLQAGCVQGEACAQAFALASGGKLITITCDNGAAVSVSRSGTDAGIGVPLAANEKFFTDTGKTIRIAVTPDGGVYSGAVVCIAPAPANTAVNLTCNVFNRTGLE